MTASNCPQLSTALKLSASRLEHPQQQLLIMWLLQHCCYVAKCTTLGLLLLLLQHCPGDDVADCS
jgi:hypothetical protein